MVFSALNNNALGFHDHRNLARSGIHIWKVKTVQENYVTGRGLAHSTLNRMLPVAPSGYQLGGISRSRPRSGSGVVPTPRTPENFGKFAKN